MLAQIRSISYEQSAADSARMCAHTQSLDKYIVTLRLREWGCRLYVLVQDPRQWPTPREAKARDRGPGLAAQVAHRLQFLGLQVAHRLAAGVQGIAAAGVLVALPSYPRQVLATLAGALGVAIAERGGLGAGVQCCAIAEVALHVAGLHGGATKQAQGAQ